MLVGSSLMKCKIQCYENQTQQERFAIKNGPKVKKLMRTTKFRGKCLVKRKECTVYPNNVIS